MTAQESRRAKLLDPTAAAPKAAPRAERPRDLKGVRVSLIGNGKENCDLLFDHLERWLRAEAGAADVQRLDKGCYWEPMPEETRKKVEAFGGVAVTGLGS
jgi:hypothetical protein